MKVKIIQPCVDKYTGKFYSAGSIVEVDEKRGAEMLTAKDYVEAVDEIAPVKPKRTRTKKA